jgi:hypothetical protein
VVGGFVFFDGGSFVAFLPALFVNSLKRISSSLSLFSSSSSDPVSSSSSSSSPFSVFPHPLQSPPHHV